MDDERAWLLTTGERGNPLTRLDAQHPREQAWSRGNLVRPLIHGATYFADLHERLEATRDGDIVFFADWRGDADERLTDDPESTISEVLGRADERGVDVRGLVWRSHWDGLSFSSKENRRLGEVLQERGAEVLLDMRVRTGGSHHQKFVVIRHKGQPERDVAYVGGIDLCHSRRDDARHHGDPQTQPMSKEYGPTPPWHDVQVAISGPAVHDVETVFRERWEDPTPLSRQPLRRLRDKVTRLDTTPDPLPEQWPAPEPVEGGTHIVQVLRTYPNLRHGLDYPFARGGERSVARGYSKALHRARRLVYVEDQYLWSHTVADDFEDALRDNADLHMVAVLPLVPDQDGAVARAPEYLGRNRAMTRLREAAGDRFLAFGIENHAGTPVYVHAKVCVVDDRWASVGSDNFNRRSWTHDSELTVAVLDEEGEDHSAYARRLRLTLAAEHLDRQVGEEDDLLDVMADCIDPLGMVEAFRESAARLEAWHVGGRRGQRPPGRLRPMAIPQLGRVERMLAATPYQLLHDPDGRPAGLRRQGRF